MFLGKKPALVVACALVWACGGEEDTVPGVGAGAGGAAGAAAGGGAAAAGAGGARSAGGQAGGAASGGGAGASDGQTAGSGSPGASGGSDGGAMGGGAGGGAGPAGDGGGSIPPVDAASPEACSNPCTSYLGPDLLGRISQPGLTALSGMAASWRTPEVVYVHNDRNRAEFFAVDLQARYLARFTLGGAQVQDIEDMEVSRCPGGTCVFVADIGNNINPRSEFVIYRAAEPAVMSGSSQDATLPAERFAFRYEDGPHNAESLIVDPATGDVYIVTKVGAGAPSTAYRLETFVSEGVNVARKVAQLPVPASGDQPATGASAHPCGAGFLLRTGNAVYEFRIAPGAAFVTAFAAAPVKVPSPNEMQSEAVSYRADGRAYYTTSEGAGPPLNRVACAP